LHEIFKKKFISQKIPGVRFFFSAKDIPGKNNFCPMVQGILPGIVEEEEIFVGQNSEILFYGQPAGLILADTLRLANLAASKVKIVYMEESSGEEFFLFFI